VEPCNLTKFINFVNTIDKRRVFIYSRFLMDDLAYWIAINEYAKFGPKSFEKLINFFSSMEHAFKADANELTLAGISKKTADQFVHFREGLSPKKLLDEVERHNIYVLRVTDEEYPPMLRNIYDPPPLLFIDGYLPPVETAQLAIVGSRKASSYGLQMADRFARELAQAGIVVVSGLAYGIDEAAHRATVKAQGVTLAVLGCGILNIETARQRYLASEIKENGGAIISEFPLRAAGLKHHYPYRNRVISGITQGTLVVEATEKSGSLITARSALEQGRDVFAIPGPITSDTSVGTNNLIKMGAVAVTKAEDILDLLNVEGVQYIQKPLPAPDSKEEGQILELLSKNPIHIDEMIRTTQLDSKTVASTLSLMEMKGRAHQIGGMYYVLGG